MGTDAAVGQAVGQCVAVPPLPLSLAQVYIGNVHFGVTEDEIRAVFGQCGPIQRVQLIKDEHNHKAYSFVDYELSQARAYPSYCPRFGPYLHQRTELGCGLWARRLSGNRFGV